MSTLQVANIFFDSTGNNKIVYDNNEITLLNGAQEAFSDSRIDDVLRKGLICDDPTGSYRISYEPSTPSGYLEVTNNAILISNYPELGALLNLNPYKDVKNVTWTNRTIANNNGQFAVAYGNGVFVSVGLAGSIQSSTNGTTWTNRTRANSSNQNAVAYGNGVFVTVGSSGSITSSTDGITWTNRTTANTQTQYGVAYGNGVFVSVGSAGSIQSSTNGTTWTNRTGVFSSSIIHRGVAYGNGVFVAVTEGLFAGITAGGIATSTNGITWSEVTGASNTRSNFAVAYGNGVFVAVGEAGTIQTSTDGIVWHKRLARDIYMDLNAVTYGDGVFIASGGPGLITNGTIQTSTNGVSWRNMTIDDSSSFTYIFNGIAYGNDVFVTVGNNTVSLGAIQSYTQLPDTISYNTTTHFKTPPFDGEFSPYDNGYGKNVRIYIKT
jgi:hypothetical protein